MADIIITLSSVSSFIDWQLDCSHRVPILGLESVFRASATQPLAFGYTCFSLLLDMVDEMASDPTGRSNHTPLYYSF